LGFVAPSDASFASADELVVPCDPSDAEASAASAVVLASPTSIGMRPYAGTALPVAQSVAAIAALTVPAKSAARDNRTAGVGGTALPRLAFAVDANGGDLFSSPQNGHVASLRLTCRAQAEHGVN
jgi:hypothetical protein